MHRGDFLYFETNKAGACASEGLMNETQVMQTVRMTALFHFKLTTLNHYRAIHNVFYYYINLLVIIKLVIVLLLFCIFSQHQSNCFHIKRLHILIFSESNQIKNVPCTHNSPVQFDTVSSNRFFLCTALNFIIPNATSIFQFR